MAKKRSTKGIGSLKSAMERVHKAKAKVLSDIRAIKQKKTLEKRLTQKLNALAKAKASLAGIKKRSKRK